MPADKRLKREFYGMTTQDIRWIQRYNHFAQAFEQLERAVELSNQRPLTELEEQGMIQAFEYTHELAWNVLKDFLENQGLRNLYGSKDSTREAFKRGLIENGEVRMDIISEQKISTLTPTIMTSLRKSFMPSGRITTQNSNRFLRKWNPPFKRRRHEVRSERNYHPANTVRPGPLPAGGKGDIVQLAHQRQP